MSSVDKSITRKLVQNAVGKAVRTDGKNLGEVTCMRSLCMSGAACHLEIPDAFFYKASYLNVTMHAYAIVVHGKSLCFMVPCPQYR